VCSFWSHFWFTAKGSWGCGACGRTAVIPDDIPDDTLFFQFIPSVPGTVIREDFYRCHTGMGGGGGAYYWATV
jgi:hypothetical protein